MASELPNSMNHSALYLKLAKARFTGFDKWPAHERKVIDEICPKIVYSAQNSIFSSKNSYEFPMVRLCVSEFFREQSVEAFLGMEFYSFNAFGNSKN